MRGELDDALARLARREQLQRRRTGGPAAVEAVLDEVADALRRIVVQHPGLAVTATLTDATGSSTVRVAWSDGSTTVVPAAEPDGYVPPAYSGGDVVEEPVAGRPPHAWPMTVRTVPPGVDPRRGDR